MIKILFGISSIIALLFGIKNLKYCYKNGSEKEKEECKKDFFILIHLMIAMAGVIYIAESYLSQI